MANTPLDVIKGCQFLYEFLTYCRQSVHNTTFTWQSLLLIYFTILLLTENKSRCSNLNSLIPLNIIMQTKSFLIYFVSVLLTISALSIGILGAPLDGDNGGKVSCSRLIRISIYLQVEHSRFLVPFLIQRNLEVGAHVSCRHHSSYSQINQLLIQQVISRSIRRETWLSW